MSICNVSSSYSLNEVVDHVRAGFFIPVFYTWTAVLKSLHWLPICRWVLSKLPVFVQYCRSLLLHKRHLNVACGYFAVKLTISSVPKCMVTVLAPVLTLIFSRY